MTSRRLCVSVCVPHPFGGGHTRGAAHTHARTLAMTLLSLSKPFAFECGRTRALGADRCRRAHDLQATPAGTPGLKQIRYKAGATMTVADVGAMPRAALTPVIVTGQAATTHNSSFDKLCPRCLGDTSEHQPSETATIHRTHATVCSRPKVRKAYHPWGTGIPWRLPAVRGLDARPISGAHHLAQGPSNVSRRDTPATVVHARLSHQHPLERRGPANRKCATLRMRDHRRPKGFRQSAHLVLAKLGRSSQPVCSRPSLWPDAAAQTRIATRVHDNLTFGQGST